MADTGGMAKIPTTPPPPHHSTTTTTPHHTTPHHPTPPHTTPPPPPHHHHHHTTRHDTTRPDPTRHDTTRHDTTRHDTTRHDTTRHDTTRHNNKNARTQQLRRRQRKDAVVMQTPLSLARTEDIPDVGWGAGASSRTVALFSRSPFAVLAAGRGGRGGRRGRGASSHCLCGMLAEEEHYSHRSQLHWSSDGCLVSEARAMPSCSSCKRRPQCKLFSLDFTVVPGIGNQLRVRPTSRT